MASKRARQRRNAACATAASTHLPIQPTASHDVRLGRWLAAAIVAAGLLAYSTSFGNPMIFDDVGAIAANLTIRDLGDLGRVFSPPPESPLAGRPLVNLSLALNYAAGRLDVPGYHAVNLALHLACALLMFGLVRRLLGSLRQPAWLVEPSATLAFAATLIWTVHPLNSEAVNYLTERTESLMAVFYLLTLYSGVRAAGSQSGRWTVLGGGVGGRHGVKGDNGDGTVMLALMDRSFSMTYPRSASPAPLRWTVCPRRAFRLMLSHPRTSSAGFASSDVSAWTYR
jgi:hypothetical protein